MKAEIALIGNPNSGKTTLFNELTGGNNSVGNWTGTTVTLDIGHFHYHDQAIDVIDLPGVYSLFTHSPEQITVCEYLVDYHPDVLVNVVDSTNLERNLYLTTQLVETGVPVIVALNMEDELRSQGQKLDAKALSNILGVPCVTMSATKRTGIERLMQTVLDVCAHPYLGRSQKFVELYSPELRKSVDETIAAIDRSSVPAHLNIRWVALQMMKEHWPGQMPQHLIGAGDDWELKIGAERYRIINSIMPRILRISPLARRSLLTRSVDKLVCHRLWAFPIFILVMLLIFFISFGPPGNAIMGLLETVMQDILPQATTDFLTQVNAGPILTGLIVEGIIHGVGAVLVFLPQLMLLFFCLALLEFSGYMARAAFITDRALSKLGLSGMSFIPMVLGFGCTVPAVIATRNLENKAQKRLTMMVLPFMSCSARMPVYALIAAAFFVENKWMVIGSLYLLGVVMAITTALLLKPRMLKQARPFFIMEMPPYRKPVWHCVWRSVWVRSWDFISHAGSVLLIASIVVWFLSNFDLSFRLVADSQSSILFDLGVLLAPLFQPLGFGEWQLSVALLTGFMSKEAVVSTLGVLYGSAPATALAGLLTPAAAYAFLVFVLLYTPCIAALTAVKRESGSWLFVLRMVAYQLLVAWLSGWAVYRLALLLM